MNHDAAVSLIGDLLHDRLSDSVKDRMLAHVRGCDDCKSLSETFALLSEAWSTGSLEHPSSDSIVRYALGRNDLDEEERDRVAEHVLSCELCAAEVEATSQAEAEITREAVPAPAERPVVQRPSLIAPMIAAAAVLVVLAYPTYLGLFEMPRIHDRLAMLEAEAPTRAPAWSGAVDLHVLQEPLRGAEDDLPSIRVEGDRPYVLLAVQPGTLEGYAGAPAVHFDIRDETGRVTWSLKMSEDELRLRARAANVVPLLVPVDELPVGRLTLSVSRGTEADDRLFDTSFVVSRID
jgi:hypothetical protein